MRLKDHLNKVEYFCLIVEAGSIKQASQKAFIGQPQLTKVVKQLEDILDTDLLVRSSKGVQTTKAGDQLYKFAKQILNTAEKAELDIKWADQNIEGHVCIGTYDSIARYFFPDFLKYLQTLTPNLHITMETGRSTYIVEKLKQGLLDVAIVVNNEAITKQVQHEVLYDDSFGLYQAPSLNTEFSDKLIYLDYPLNKTKNAMKKYGFIESIVCDNLETVRSLTEQAIGIGLLPHRVAREGVLLKRLIPHKHPKLKNNSFDLHQVVLCHLPKPQKTEKTFVLEEVHKFLALDF